MDDGWAVFLIIIIFIFGIMIGFVIMSDTGINLKQEVANDVCILLTGNENTIAEKGNDCSFAMNCNLVCVLPSYDATHNIIIKNRGDEE